MKIILNGEETDVPESTVGALLSSHGYSRSVAVFVNGNQLLMMNYTSYDLKPGDRVRIIRPLGGG